MIYAFNNEMHYLIQSFPDELNVINGHLTLYNQIILAIK